MKTIKEICEIISEGKKKKLTDEEWSRFLDYEIKPSSENEYENLQERATAILESQ